MSSFAMRRRPFLACLLPGTALAAGVDKRALRFPADHGAHPESQLEWWYVTGYLRVAGPAVATTPPDFGFQVTFFRSRTGLAAGSASAFAPGNSGVKSCQANAQVAYRVGPAIRPQPA